jgi:hypothetical protein
MSPKLDHSGQFAALLERLADGRRCRFVDTEHGASMGAGTATGNHADEAPPGKPETLPGPIAHRGRVTGMEIPGALTEMAARGILVSDGSAFPASVA